MNLTQATFGFGFRNYGVINVTGAANNYGLVAFGSQAPASQPNYVGYGAVVLNHGLAVAGVADAMDMYNKDPTSGGFYLSNGSGVWASAPLNYTNVYFLDGAANGIDLSPQASGTLYQFGGSIYGFQAGDAIGLEETSSMSLVQPGVAYDPNTGILAVTANGGQTIGQFHMVGNYNGATFTGTEVSGNDLVASSGYTHRYVITVSTPPNTWVAPAAVPTHYGVASAWSSNPVVPNGSANVPAVATVGLGTALLSAVDPALSNITLNIGALAFGVNETSTPQSVLDITDLTLDASVTIDADIVGGSVGNGQNGATGVSGLFMHGATTTYGKIAVEAGNVLFLQVTPTDMATAAPGLYTNLGEIDLNGTATSGAALLFGQPKGYAANSLAIYGTIKANYGYLFANVNDAASPASATTGQITLANHSSLVTSGGELTHTNVVFADGSSELVLTRNADTGLYDFGGAANSLSGLQAGDLISFVADSKGQPTSLAYDAAAEVLTVSGNGATLGTVHISGAGAGAYTTANFIGLYNSQGNFTGSSGAYDVRFATAQETLDVPFGTIRSIGQGTRPAGGPTCSMSRQPRPSRGS